jgi:hypothetical protein
MIFEKIQEFSCNQSKSRYRDEITRMTSRVALCGSLGSLANFLA